jgi:uracil-DNA glycosylase
VAEILWNSLSPEWQDCLSGCKADIASIEARIAQVEHSGARVVPDLEVVFAALSITPADVSVIVLGQDPYPNSSHAVGLAFAVPKDTNPLPGSLRNMFKECSEDTGMSSNTDASLLNWLNQGVLLLNTTLTTEEGVRAAHTSWQWQTIVEAIIESVTELNPKVVAMLWGNHAQSFSAMFEPESLVCSAHPSPLSAHRGFLGSKPFSRANQTLISNHKNPVQW